MEKYFVFSREQMNMKRNMAKKLSQEYKPGLVFIGNSYKEFTDIVDNPSLAKFSDSIIVTSGDINTIKYKPGSDY